MGKEEKQESKCFRCDGSKKICNICGDSILACECEDGAEEIDCPDCNGTGK